MTDKKTFKGFPLDSRGDVIGAFPTVDVIQERTKDLMNEVTGNINQMTIDYCLKFNIDPDVLIKQKAEIELLQMKIADIKANCDFAIEGRDVKIKELEQQIEKLIDFVLSKTECCDICPITDTCINSEGTCPYAGILAKGEEEVTREWLMQFITKEIKEK